MIKKSKEIKNKTLGRFILGTFLLLAILIWLAVFQIPDKNLHLYFLDVGQGDSIYVRTMNNYDLLIDGGPDTKVLSELGEVMPFWDHKIDLVILTHPHADHISGLIEVLKRYQIGEILTTDAVHTSSEYLEWLEVIRDKEIPFTVVQTGQSKDLDAKTKLKILWPEEKYEGEKVNNLNNTSVVGKLIFDRFSVLLSGDAEEEVQAQLLSDQAADLPSNILKIPHHGSSNAALEDFFQLVNPDVAVISVGESNKFGHPAKTTLDKLEEIGAKILRTDQNSRIEIISDGQTFWSKTKK